MHVCMHVCVLLCVCVCVCVTEELSAVRDKSKNLFRKLSSGITVYNIKG